MNCSAWRVACILASMRSPWVLPGPSRYGEKPLNRTTLRIRTILLAVTLIGGAAAQAAATPLKMTYTVEASASPGLYDYDFWLTLDNNDGSWLPGQEWDWIIFGDNNGAGDYPSFDPNGGADYLGSTWVTATFDYPIDRVDSTTGQHNGPHLQIGTEHFAQLPGWSPTAIGQYLSWSGSSSQFIPEGQLRWSALMTKDTPAVSFAIAEHVPDSASTMPILFFALSAIGMAARRTRRAEQERH